jgi:hypothetical protein
MLNIKDWFSKNSSDWSINRDLVEFLLTFLPQDSTILELGSGKGTEILSSIYKMYSIEENINFVDIYDSHYIFAPIKDGWYDVDILRKEISDIKYDAILIDGPAHGERLGFYDWIHLFKTDCVMIFDDIDRPDDLKTMELVSQRVNRECITLPDGQTGVIL